MIKDRFFREILDKDTDREPKVYSAYREGVKDFKRGYDEQVRDGYIDPKKEKFLKPTREEAIYQGMCFYEDNSDYEEITEKEAKSTGVED